MLAFVWTIFLENRPLKHDNFSVADQPLKEDVHNFSIPLFNIKVDSILTNHCSAVPSVVQ